MSEEADGWWKPTPKPMRRFWEARGSPVHIAYTGVSPFFEMRLDAKSNMGVRFTECILCQGHGVTTVMKPVDFFLILPEPRKESVEKWIRFNTEFFWPTRPEIVYHAIWWCWQRVPKVLREGTTFPHPTRKTGVLEE